MAAPIEADLARLLAERAIERQLSAYCRAMDRCDADLGRSVFAPDAEADYGDMYRGTGPGFVDFALAAHAAMDAHVHRIGNVSVVVDGDTAGSECYVDARFRVPSPDGPLEIVSSGRYVDRWAGRDGVWVITSRRYLHGIDSMRPLENGMFATGGSRDASDPSYEVLVPPG
ncbi:nuclear transport factor 2 family protein [Trujillonella endophytica]|uniref:SnoaL-like domain-containing protein n=1 Tax=Trujillonella endophytica TaxID=673521 RepID=A0A1H8VYG0_9ACTN|nr:nuclear transport factor 2 family protein [Trujillella endophytica]SEP20429.1 SnoaL-like domain-containing protein [Trujillella endophytica]